MSVDPSTRQTRRGLLAAATAAVAGLFAGGIGRTALVQAANGDAVQVGKSYQGTKATTLANTSTADGKNGIVGRSASGTGAGVLGDNTSDGDGVLGTSQGGTALHGITDYGIALRATATGLGVGIFAEAHGSGPAVTAANVSGPGIQGVAGSGQPGVSGTSDTGPGVAGTTSGASVPSTRAGVVGASDAHVGGYFTSDTGAALKVDGRAVFSRGGRFTIAPGIISKLVQVQGVRPSSYVLAMIQADRPGVHIRAVVPKTDAFVVHFNAAPAQNTVVGYLVLN
jgi:hypothetical protein